MSDAQNSASRLHRLERALAESRAPIVPAADSPEALTLHLNGLTEGRLRRLTALLQGAPDATLNDVDAIALQLLLNDYAAGTVHLRAIVRGAAASIDRAGLVVRDVVRFVHDEGIGRNAPETSNGPPHGSRMPGGDAIGFELLGPGVRAAGIESPYSTERVGVHPGTSVRSRTPLTLRTEGTAQEYMATFPPAVGAFARPAHLAVLGWLVRVHVELLVGAAKLSITTDNPGRAVGKAAALTAGSHRVDLLFDDPTKGAQVTVRGKQGSVSELKILGLDCYALIDEESQVLAPPAQVSLVPVPRWSRFYGEPDQNITERIRHFRFARLVEPRPMRWLEGLELSLVPGEQISQAVYVSGLYEPCTLSALRRILKAGDTFVDVGANIGLVTLLASRWVGPGGRVVSVEPSQREYDRLCLHVERNALPNVQTIRTACGNHDGTATLHVASADRSGLNTLESRFMYDDVQQLREEHVPLRRLDDVVAAQAITRVDVIKIDVEGSEAAVVAGARETIERDRPTLIVEVGGDTTRGDDPGRPGLETSLRELGYQFIAIDGETASLRRVRDLTPAAENFLIAQPAVIAALGREWPILD